MDDPEIRSVSLPRQTLDLYGEESLLSQVKLVKAVREDGGTNTGTTLGVRAKLIDVVKARRLRDLNDTHQTCLDAKRSSSVGMGHREESIYDTLDPLTRYGWQDVLDSLGDDFEDTGDAFLEAVYDGNKIVGLNHLDASAVHVVVEQEDDSETYHYQVISDSALSTAVSMARWGDLAGLKERFGNDGVRQSLGNSRMVTLTGEIVDSEIIHFRQPNSRDPYYGFVDWMAAVPSIELVQMMTRHKFDLHFNRGVPEIIYHLIGPNVSNKAWDEIKAIFRASQGIGNSHKSAAIQIPANPDQIQIQVERLSQELGSQVYADDRFALAMAIATAHGIPPMLANILLPGKIGAANEGPNALLLFQKRKLNQIQKTFSRTLATTLGESTLGVSSKDFLGERFKDTDDQDKPIYHETGNGFKTVLDGMTLGAQDALSRMKEPITGSGRDPEKGLLGGTDDRSKADPRRTR